MHLAGCHCATGEALVASADAMTVNERVGGNLIQAEFWVLSIRQRVVPRVRTTDTHAVTIKLICVPHSNSGHRLALRGFAKRSNLDHPVAVECRSTLNLQHGPGVSRIPPTRRGRNMKE